MRIGTWNLAGRWSAGHEALLQRLDCDVWLLTEVSDRLVLDGYELHPTVEPMARRRQWSAVLLRSGVPHGAVERPHPTTVSVVVRGAVFASSVLPWRSSGAGRVWVGETHAARTGAAVDQLRQAWSGKLLVWGGDWNHALSGREWAGSIGGRQHVQSLLDELRLVATTAALPHALPGCLAIDHVAVPATWAATAIAQHVPAIDRDGRRLSDHDAYVATVEA